MIKKNTVRKLTVLSLIFVFTNILASGSLANITKKELKTQCEQNITQKLGGSANVLHSDIKALCATIDLIPNDNIDDDLASWIVSSYWQEVSGYGVGAMNVDSVRHRLIEVTQLTKRICPLITHTGTYYKEQSNHLISVSSNFRNGIFGAVKERLALAKSIKLDVSNASQYTNVVRRVADSFAISVNNFGDDTDWKMDYSNRIESQIISLTLIEAIHSLLIQSVYNDVFEYKSDLFLLLPYLDKGTQEKSGTSLHDYSDRKAQIKDFIDKVLIVDAGVVYVDWGNLSRLLRNDEFLIWKNNYQIPLVKKNRKIIYIITAVPNMADLLHESTVDLLQLSYHKDKANSKELLQDSIEIVNANP